jgi:hypothetical protein
MLLASMPHIIDEISTAFEKAMGRKAKPASTPGIPGKTMAKHEGEPFKIQQYRSITGKVMWYTTKVGPEVANAARDLTSHLSNPGEEQWKFLERCVGYLTALPEEYRSLTYRRPPELRSIMWTDSDMAKCEETRKRFTGGLSTIGGTTNNWWSRKQATVSLSSTESEYISYATGCQEAMFVNMLLEEILGTRPKPAIIFEDNQGCIFFIKNKMVSQRTKHISVRLHFSREQFQLSRVLPVFCQSENNYSDGMTKGQAVGLFEDHMKIIRTGKITELAMKAMKSSCRREDVGDGYPGGDKS